MELAGANRLMLRAELRHATESFVSYALELTASTVFVVTDWQAPIDTSVSIRLSFLDVIEPVEAMARVVGLRVAGSPGDLAGAVLRFEEASRAPILALVERLEEASAAEGLATEHPFRVLLVEDNRFIRDMFAYGIRKFFQQPGFDVDHAEDAEHAWHKLRATSYDLAIVDYYLPAEDGASLIARVRRDDRLSRMPVVAISVGGRDAREATISAGADLFVDKPLVFRDLFNTLRVLRQREAGRLADKRKAILVFDDSPLVLAFTRAALEAAGFEVAVAEDLSQFELQRTEFEPDLILVDIQMPEAFGDDVASALREWHGVRVPILLVSSLPENELARRAQAAEVDGYVPKAAGVTELVRRCKEILGEAA
jgi:DNA-binding response OmpR family regulator